MCIRDRHLNLFVNLSDEAAGAEIMVEKTNDDKEKALEMTIEELDLSVRSFNCLKRAGINLSLIHIYPDFDPSPFSFKYELMPRPP